MLNLSELVRGGTFCLSSAGLGVGNSDAKDLDIDAPNGAGVDFCIKGVMYHKADTQDIAVTAAAEQAALTTCIYLVTLDHDGTLATVKGTEVTTADLASGKSVLEIPLPAADTCPIGYVRIEVATGYTFTAGTTNFTATGITETYVNLFAIPETPITS